MQSVRSILLIEDQPEDAELIIGALQRESIPVTLARAETIPGVGAELANNPGVVLCGHSVAQAPLEDALSIVREHDPDLPFIVVCGPVMDEHTASFLSLSASGIVRKDRLDLLAPVIDREVNAASVRRSYRKLEAQATSADKRFRALVERSADGILIVDRDARVRYKGPQILGYPETDWHGRSAFWVVHPVDRERIETAFQQIVSQPDAGKLVRTGAVSFNFERRVPVGRT